MLPEISEVAANYEITEYEIQSSRTYELRPASGTIGGLIDELDSMEQVVYKILNTERFECPLYTWNYGIELNELIGEPITFVLPELERRITEALMQDERITAVDALEFEISGGAVLVSFVVNTIFGDVEATKEVEY